MQKDSLNIADTTGYGVETLKPNCVLPEGVNFLLKPCSPDNPARMARRCSDEPIQI